MGLFPFGPSGQVNLKGAQKSAVRTLTANPETLSSDTDFMLAVDTSVGESAFEVILPAGVQGQEFFVKDIGNNASNLPITFTPTGLDVVATDVIIGTNKGFVHIQFISGTWQSI